MPRVDLRPSSFAGPGFRLYDARGCSAAPSFTPHFHLEYLIAAQLQGIDACHIGRQLYHFVPGDIVLINPHQVHTGNADSADSLQYVSLYVDHELVKGLAEELGVSTMSPEFTVVKTSPHPELVGELIRMLDLVRARHDRTTRPRDGRGQSSEAVELDDNPDRLAIDCALHSVVLHVFEGFSNLRSPWALSTQRVGNRRIARALGCIRALDPEAPTSPSLGELAAVAGLSKFHFLRQFSETVGMTPGAYLRTLRLCHAARKLRISKAPIFEIALRSGFSDHPSFSRAFARHMGMTPSQYQQLASC